MLTYAIGPLYLALVFSFWLPAAYFLWTQTSLRIADSWLAAPLLSSISSCLILYGLGLLGLVGSRYFLVSLPAFHGMLFAWAILRSNNKTGLRNFAAAHLKANVIERRLFFFLASATALLSIFSTRIYPHFYDSWNYHLSIASMALSTGKIPLEFSHPYVGSSPPFLELWKTWIWIVFRNVGIVEGNQLPFALALAGISYVVARRLFALRAHFCALAALFVFFLPS